MLNLKRTTSECHDFHELIRSLDVDLTARYGIQQSFYKQYNAVDRIDTVVIAYIENYPAGCGCFKKFDETTVEIKRMYVKPEYRGKGISKQILAELEKWAAESGFTTAVLETGVHQPEAIGLYQKAGYVPIDNYGQYARVDTSICFKKRLTGL